MADTRSVEADPSRHVPAGAPPDTAAMWAEFGSRLRAFVARRVPAGIEPDDIVQDVFLRVVRHLPSLRDGERIEAWLFQIARNAVQDALRRRHRRDSRTDALDGDLPAETDSEDTGAAEADLAPCLTPMITRLPEPYRTAIELTSLQGLTQAEAAVRVGLSISGMKSRVQRGRDRLKQMLLRCCAIEVDRRGGISDYHPGASASCGCGSKGSAPAGCAPEPCSPPVSRPARS